MDVDQKRIYPFIWTAAFIVSALAAYWLVRATLETTSSDPTRDRIRALIDEADQLLQSLDDRRRA